ncbi:motility associated factor glycosyltransferase family protein [Paenibacillus abyssi]|uniref:DUF115 domain-containing protein n=2 Tax=Paenibacillus abyssi TaxID=1340531 RepID=A0A917CMU0_9BACL|nr:6-hydroxymethylpterin diphosphokinase MptE-like protein [Paenibacillus abyssi]GGF91479.1 hypothetical protein GCM10010916_05970 [Paenibacillus abyssi]
MTFEKNMQLLKESYHNAWQYIEAAKDSIQKEPVEIQQARNGQANLCVQYGGKTVYLHSQYNPMNEAEKWTEPYIEQIKQSKHVFFFGLGMGYHIESLAKYLKTTPYTIYEPIPAVLYRMMQARPLHPIANKNLKNIVCGSSLETFLRFYFDNFTNDVLVIINPVYERAFPELTKTFIETFKKSLEMKRTSIHTNLGYERLWSYNAQINLMKVIETPNILRLKNKVFDRKPIVLVAAGPSLEEEIENLRYIKQKGLAYIFAVGSANKALLSHQIYPDAVVSYDPNTYNHQVLSEIMNNNITDIPLIFGSTIGYQTLEVYPGPMLHMFMSQDHISPYFLNKEQLTSNDEVITDAASVAVVALQVANKLNAGTVVLVGQNFSFKNQQYYSQGIQYDTRSTFLGKEELEGLIAVEDVYGGEVQTNEAHNIARGQMEQVIVDMPDIPVINTTKGGAKIKGSRFEELSEVIKNRLKEAAVEQDWYKENAAVYDYGYIQKQQLVMNAQHEELHKLMINIVKTLKKLESAAAISHIKKTNDMLDQISKQNKDLFRNEYYRVFIEPMVRVQFDIFQKSVLELNELNNKIKKARAIVKSFGAFVLSCQEAIRDNEPIFNVLKQQLGEKVMQALNYDRQEIQ